MKRQNTLVTLTEKGSSSRGNAGKSIPGNGKSDGTESKRVQPLNLPFQKKLTAIKNPFEFLSKNSNCIERVFCIFKLLGLFTTVLVRVIFRGQ